MTLELQGKIDRVHDINSRLENTVYKVIEGTTFSGRLITGEVMIQVDEKNGTFVLSIKTAEEMVEEHVARFGDDNGDGCNGGGDAEMLDEDGNSMGILSGGSKNKDSLDITPLVKSRHEVA